MGCLQLATSYGGKLDCMSCVQLVGFMKSELMPKNYAMLQFLSSMLNKCPYYAEIECDPSDNQPSGLFCILKCAWVVCIFIIFGMFADIGPLPYEV